MTTYASFKPSVQFLEAGEKGQQFANAANTFKPLLSQEARQSIEGIDKVSQAFTATGRALEHFGFDEAEPEVTTSEVELISTDDSQIVDNMNPRFSDFVPDSLRPSTYVIEGGQALQENGWQGTGEAVENAGHVMRVFGFDEAEADGLTGTGPTMPAFDESRPLKPSEGALIASGTLGTASAITALTPAAPAAPFLAAGSGLALVGSAVLGAFGLDVDEATPHIPEVGVDALA